MLSTLRDKIKSCYYVVCLYSSPPPYSSHSLKETFLPSSFSSCSAPHQPSATFVNLTSDNTSPSSPSRLTDDEKSSSSPFAITTGELLRIAADVVKLMQFPLTLVFFLTLVVCLGVSSGYHGSKSPSSNHGTSSLTADLDSTLDFDDDELDLTCPFECDCKFQQQSQLTVDCSNRGLTYVPKNIPSNARRLDLRQNEITTVDDGAFQGLHHLDELILFQNGLTEIGPGMFKGLKNLKTLLLNANNITSVEKDTFSGLTSLTLLSLYDNRIETIPEGTFDSLENIQVMHLGKNPFKCDCHLRWMVDYLGRNPSLETSGARCEKPKKLARQKMSALDPDRLSCMSSTSSEEVTSVVSSPTFPPSFSTSTTDEDLYLDDDRSTADDKPSPIASAMTDFHGSNKNGFSILLCQKGRCVPIDDMNVLKVVCPVLTDTGDAANIDDFKYSEKKKKRRNRRWKRRNHHRGHRHHHRRPPPSHTSMEDE